MASPLKTIKHSELVIGLVGRIGIDMRAISSGIENVMKQFDYRVVNIHVTDYLSNFPNLPDIQEVPIENRYNSYIDACNILRNDTDRFDIMALIGIGAISKSRSESSGDYKKPATRTVYIINQLKRPEEISLFRQVYGSLLFRFRAMRRSIFGKVRFRARLQIITAKNRGRKPG